MNRRSFLRSMIGGLAGAAAVRTFPFRVFSFPKQIQVADSGSMSEIQQQLRLSLELLQDSSFEMESFLRKKFAVRLSSLRTLDGRRVLRLAPEVSDTSVMMRFHDA